MQVSLHCRLPVGSRKPFSGSSLPIHQASRLHSYGSCRLLVTARVQVRDVGLFGTKAGMTQIFTKDGLMIPATVIALDEGNVVTQILRPETHGYAAVQVGYQVCKKKKVTKPELGHLTKAGLPPMRKLREFKVNRDLLRKYQVGQQLVLERTFKVGDLVDVAGTSIGKGFQGTIKRWNHARGLMTHGSKSKRQHGSIGQCATPSRVFPGLKMAGQMGNKRVTIKKLEVLMINKELKAIVVKGAVPGKAGNVLEITKAKKW